MINIYFFSSLKNLAAYLWNENVPLMIIRSYGLIGYIRVVVKEHNGLQFLTSFI